MSATQTTDNFELLQQNIERLEILHKQLEDEAWAVPYEKKCPRLEVEGLEFEGKLKVSAGFKNNVSVSICYADGRIYFGEVEVFKQDDQWKFDITFEDWYRKAPGRFSKETKNGTLTSQEVEANKLKFSPEVYVAITKLFSEYPEALRKTEIFDQQEKIVEEVKACRDVISKIRMARRDAEHLVWRYQLG